MFNYRIYLISDKYIKLWVPLGIIFVSVAVLMLGAVYLDYNPTETQPILGTETEAVQVDVQTQSQLTNDTILYEENDTISGPLYLNETNKEVQVQYNIEGDREIETDINAYVSIVGEEEDFEFWNQEFELENREVTGTEESGSATVDMKQIREQSFDVREQFNQEGVITTNIVFEVEYTSDEYSGSFKEEMQILFRGETFSIIPPEFEETETHRINTVEGQEEVGDSLFINSGLVAGGLGVLMFLVRFGLADPSRKRKDYVLMRFDDWISTTSVERDDESENIVALNKCEDLVDVAADTNGRVIYYEDDDELAVHENGRCYLYEVDDEDNSKIRFGLLEFSGDDDNEEAEDDKSDDDDSTSIRDRFRFIG